MMDDNNLLDCLALSKRFQEKQRVRCGRESAAQVANDERFCSEAASAVMRAMNLKIVAQWRDLILYLLVSDSSTPQPKLEDRDRCLDA